MKTFQDMLKDMAANDELKLEALKALNALNSDELKVTEEQYGDVVAFGKAHGYDFTEEDIHLYRATNRELDDSELNMIAGGDCKCSGSGDCDSVVNTTHGDTHGKGYCMFDYSCYLSWNSCNISNKCQATAGCDGNAR